MPPRWRFAGRRDSLYSTCSLHGSRPKGRYLITSPGAAWRPRDAQSAPTGGGRGRALSVRRSLEAPGQFGEHRGVTLALDVRPSDWRRHFNVAGQRGAGHSQAKSSGGCGFAARNILLPRRADVIETVRGDAACHAAGVDEIATQFDLAAEPAIAGDLRDFEAAAKPVAADLEALAVGQDV